MKLSRRGWNNLMILGIIVFMVVLNLPKVMKSYMNESRQELYPYLLNPDAEVEQLHFAKWSLELKDGRWAIRVNSPVSHEEHIASQEPSPEEPSPEEPSPEELVLRWISLVGTEVDEAMFSQLNNSLSSASTLEVWYRDQEEPQRVTYYRTPKFWLLKNWQQKWIAISAEDEYLFPF